MRDQRRRPVVGRTDGRSVGGDDVQRLALQMCANGIPSGVRVRNLCTRPPPVHQFMDSIMCVCVCMGKTARSILTVRAHLAGRDGCTRQNLITHYRGHRGGLVARPEMPIRKTERSAGVAAAASVLCKFVRGATRRGRAASARSYSCNLIYQHAIAISGGERLGPSAPVLSRNGILISVFLRECARACGYGRLKAQHFAHTVFAVVGGGGGGWFGRTPPPSSLAGTVGANGSRSREAEAASNQQRRCRRKRRCRALTPGRFSIILNRVWERAYNVFHAFCG